MGSGRNPVWSSVAGNGIKAGSLHCKGLSLHLGKVDAVCQQTERYPATDTQGTWGGTASGGLRST